MSSTDKMKYLSIGRLFVGIGWDFKGWWVVTHKGFKRHQLLSFDIITSPDDPERAFNVVIGACQLTAALQRKQ